VRSIGRVYHRFVLLRRIFGPHVEIDYRHACGTRDERWWRCLLFPKRPWCEKHDLFLSLENCRKSDPIPAIRQFRIFPNKRDQLARVLRIDGTVSSNVFRRCTINSYFAVAATFGRIDSSAKRLSPQTIGRRCCEVTRSPGD